MDRQALVVEWSNALLCALLVFIPMFGYGKSDPPPATPLGLPRFDEAVQTEADMAKLGARLFADKRLSIDGQVSCASCHRADHAFADTSMRSKGRAGREGTRNAPSLFNVAYFRPLFWDGRVADLASQARAPFTNPVEHALPDESTLLRIVQEDENYAAAFKRIFDAQPGELRIDMITRALVAFEHTLLAGDSPFDRYTYSDDSSALSAAAARGLKLFKGRAGCTACHLIGRDSSLLTDQQFHLGARGIASTVTRNLPALTNRVVTAKRDSSRALERLIATDPEIAALGRYAATLAPADIGNFKTPSLRNVANTAPYMHDGSVATLSEAVDLELYSRGSVTRPIVLTRAEKQDLLEFLAALSSPARSVSFSAEQR
jgi:cytochrome c peroxidase